MNLVIIILKYCWALLSKINIYPYFVAIFPVLDLLNHNLGKLRPVDGLICVSLLVLGAQLLLWLAGLFCKNPHKSALIVSAVALWFFSYQDFYDLVDRGWISGFIAPYLFAVILSLGLLGLLVLVISRIKWNLSAISAAANAFTLVMVLIPAVHISYYNLKKQLTPADITPPAGAAEPLRLKAPDAKPNIYYIILDGYARSDILRELYAYDNRGFYDFLEKKGFFTAHDSYANYCQTLLSLSSSLNFDYLDKLAAKAGEKEADWPYLIRIIRNSRTVKLLKTMGYKTVAFDAAGPWDPVKFKTADEFHGSFFWNSYYLNLLRSTQLNGIMKAVGYPLAAILHNIHRNKIFDAMDKLIETGSSDKPLFVFAHFLSPHQPFVFDAKGGNPSADLMQFSIWCWTESFRKNYKYKYTQQLTYTTSLITRTLEKLLANSKKPPIIILQSDHGPSSGLDPDSLANSNAKERMAILNSYYLPGVDRGALYPAISPVNSFRVILNSYFGAGLPLLDNESYFSTWPKPFVFHKVFSQKTPAP